MTPSVNQRLYIFIFIYIPTSPEFFNIVFLYFIYPFCNSLVFFLLNILSVFFLFFFIGLHLMPLLGEYIDVFVALFTPPPPFYELLFVF